jgi:hypothetical protein
MEPEDIRAVLSDHRLLSDCPLEVVVRLRQHTLRVEVQDRAPRPSLLLPGVGDSMAGRGLRIVEEVADGWGTEPLIDGGKAVWFELAFD